MMRTLFCFALAATAAFCADPVFRSQSVGHVLSADGIHPGLMPGVAGVGLETAGIPCATCYIVLPPAQYTVETGNVGGAATSSFQVTEAGTPVLSDPPGSRSRQTPSISLASVPNFPMGTGMRGLRMWCIQGHRWLDGAVLCPQRQHRPPAGSKAKDIIEPISQDGRFSV